MKLENQIILLIKEFLEEELEEKINIDINSKLFGGGGPLDSLSLVNATRMIQQIQKCIPLLERKNHRSQIIGGVLKGNKPLFFAMRYIYEELDAPYFFQLIKISSDEYLDLYNLNKII